MSASAFNLLHCYLGWSIWKISGPTYIWKKEFFNRAFSEHVVLIFQQNLTNGSLLLTATWHLKSHQHAFWTVTFTHLKALVYLALWNFYPSMLHHAIIIGKTLVPQNYTHPTITFLIKHKISFLLKSPLVL